MTVRAPFKQATLTREVQIETRNTETLQPCVTQIRRPKFANINGAPTFVALSVIREEVAALDEVLISIGSPLPSVIRV